MTIDFGALLPAAASIAFVACVAVIAFLAGQRVRISKIKLPVVEMEFSERDLPDRFQALTMVLPVVSPTESLKELADFKDPNILVYIGWHVVCDTFIGLHGEYPSSENLLKRVSDLGAQNIEFINIYRDVYERSIVGGGRRKVPLDYARKYLSRAFSLAERVNPEARREHGPRIRKLLYRLDPNFRDAATTRGGWL